MQDGGRGAPWDMDGGAGWERETVTDDGKKIPAPGANGGAMAPRDLFLTLSVVLLWGCNILVVRAGTQELPPFLLTGLRFILAALLLVPFHPRPIGKFKQTLALAVVLGVGHFGLLFAALQSLDAATGAIMLQLGVPFSALLSLGLYRERLGAMGWLGMALAIGGVILVEGGPSHAGSGWGLVLVLVSAFCWALANIIVKSIGAVDVMGLNGWVAMLAAPMVLTLSAIFETGHVAALASARWAGWGAVVYTAIGATIVSYAIWYRLIARLAVNRVVPFVLLTPVVAVAGAALLLGEILTWMALLGGALTILGVAVIQFRPKPD